MNEDFLNLSFLGGLPEGLLNQEQQAAAQDRARQAAALQLGLGMIAGAQGQRGAGKPGLAQIVAQAGPGAIQAYQSSFDQTLKNALTSMQLSEMQRKRAEQERMRQAISGAYTMRPTAEGVMATQTNIDPALLEGMSAEQVIAAAPRTERVVDRQRLLSAIAEFAPEKYLELTQTKEGKETFRPMSDQEKKAYGLPADRSYQISSTGKIDEIGKGPLVVFPEAKAPEAMWTELGKELPKLAAQARSANQTNQALSSLVEMGEKKTFSGLLAPGQIGAAQFLTSFGVKVAPETLANSRTFQAASNVLVLDFMASMGGARGFSKEESAILYDAFPKIIDDPQSRTRIAKMLIDRNNRIIEEFGTTKSTFEKATNTKTPFGDIQPLKLQERAAPTSQMSDQQLIRKHLGRQ